MIKKDRSLYYQKILGDLRLRHRVDYIYRSSVFDVNEKLDSPLNAPLKAYCILITT